MENNKEWQKKQLSDHFTLGELCRSEKYPHLVVPPSPLIQDYLRQWATGSLEPLRYLVGRLKSDSGYRNPKLNKAVGGVDDSIHQIIVNGQFAGCATDVVPLNTPLNMVFRLLGKALFLPVFQNAVLPIRGVIIYPDRKFIHLDSRKTAEPRFYESRTKGEYTGLTIAQVLNYGLKKE